MHSALSAMSFYFIDPVLASCANRSQLALANTAIGNPEDWFPWTEGVSFDFFIDWQNDTLDREVWLKRPVNTEVVNNVSALTDAQVEAMLKEDAKFPRLVDFAGKNGLTAAAMIFDDSQNWASPNASLIKATWPANTETMYGLTIERMTLSDLQAIIRQKSGGPVQIGSKGLMYGTSRLECMLSSTTALWPGDVDFVVTDVAGKAIGILEFKKHTASSRLALNQQCLGNYYPRPDGRKYDRLALLAEQLGDESLPMLVIYYSVVQGCPHVYIEEIHGTKGQLTGGSIVQYQMNPKNVAASAAHLMSLIRSML